MRSQILSSIRLIVLPLIFLTISCSEQKDPNTVQELIQELKEESVSGILENSELSDFIDDKEILANPILILELKQAESYYLKNLIRLLNEMPSPERDEAYLEILKNWKTREDKWLAHWYLTRIIIALAETESDELLPVLTNMLNDPETPGDVQAQCNIALNIMGHSPDARDENIFLHKSDFESADSISVLCDDPEIQAPIKATFDQVWYRDLKWKFEIRSCSEIDWKESAFAWMTVDEDYDFAFSETQFPDSPKTHEIKGSFKNETGTWSVELCTLDQDTRVAHLEYYRPTIDAASYKVVLQKSGDRWLAIEYMMLSSSRSVK